MFKKWKHAVDNNKVFGALFTDLPKVIDCICHDYGVLLLAMKLVHKHFQKHKQGRNNGKTEPLYGTGRYMHFSIPSLITVFLFGCVIVEF